MSVKNMGNKSVFNSEPVALDNKIQKCKNDCHDYYTFSSSDCFSRHCGHS